MAEYIKRSDVLEKQSTMVEYDEGGWDAEVAVVKVDRIKAIPAADVVEVVHGKWEYLQDDEWRCSNCHTVFNTGGKWMPMTDNFCSECGADMRKRRDNNAAD